MLPCSTPPVSAGDDLSLNESMPLTDELLRTQLFVEESTEQTQCRQTVGFMSAQPTQEGCLVQIYPPDVVDGMLMLEGVLVAGRDLQADLVLDDSGVSRQHCQFTCKADRFELQDLGSTNGTRVNGATIEHHTLASGDIIQIGGFMFKFLSAGSVESQYHETVYSLMTTDALTGAMNKRYLLETMQREIARCLRHHRSLSVVMLDIDHFKSVNDTHGHLVGDDVLREFASRIHDVCREDDIFGRYGGEEFCLLLSETETDLARDKAEHCREAIAAVPFETTVGPLPITASFGVAAMAAEKITHLPSMARVESLLADADERLYEAKRAGRNRVMA
ncbi:MAG: GGDEF domain-containing protein [Planctomycetota bacterium]